MYPKLKKNFFLKIKPDKFELCNPNILPFANLSINETAFDIFSLCDGNTDVDHIVKSLLLKYKISHKELKIKVDDFLANALQKDITVFDEKASIIPYDFIKGSNKIYYPDIISWEITDYCPLNCLHCYLDKKNSKFIALNEIDKILSIIPKCGLRSIQITGGEPLLHPNLGYILNKLSDLKIPVILLTSGFKYNFKTFEILNIFKKTTNSSVRVSLDGNQKIHNDIRKNPQAFENTIDFIKMLNKQNIPCQVAITAINQSPSDIENLVELLKSLGVYYVEIGLLVNEGNASKNKLPSQYNNKKISELLFYLDKKYSDDNFKIKTVVKNKDYTCGAGLQLIHITTNLDIKPCPVMDFKLGNINLNSFDDIMKKSTELFSKIKIPNNSTCCGCAFEDDCNGCIAQALNKHKRLLKNCSWFESQKNYIFKTRGRYVL